MTAAPRSHPRTGRFRDRPQGAWRWTAPITMLIAILVGTATVAGTAPGGGTGYATVRAVVLMYHRFGESEYPATSIRLAQFDAQLKWLRREQFHVWPLSRIVEHLIAGKPIPDRTIAITVDDAYLSVYREAFPRLRRYGWPFTVFVSTDAVDEELPAYMSWDQMREMQRNGASYANHSASHDHLLERHPGETDAQWRKRVSADIEHAQTRIREELGSGSHLFAYPYGEFDPELADLVAGLGFTAFGQESGAIGPYADLRALPRYPMSESYADLEQFATKAVSLPLPVAEVHPWDPVVGAGPPPRMEIRLADSDAVLDELACYGVKQEVLKIQWLDRTQRRFAVQGSEPVPPGRSRYNCTAPSATSGRYYWFSHPWFRRP